MSTHIKKVKFTRVIEIKHMISEDRNSITNLMQYLHIALTASATAQTMRNTEKLKNYDNTKKRTILQPWYSLYYLVPTNYGVAALCRERTSAIMNGWRTLPQDGDYTETCRS